MLAGIAAAFAVALGVGYLVGYRIGVAITESGETGDMQWRDEL